MVDNFAIDFTTNEAELQSSKNTSSKNIFSSIPNNAPNIQAKEYFRKLYMSNEIIDLNEIDPIKAATNNFLGYPKPNYVTDEKIITLNQWIEMNQ